MASSLIHTLVNNNINLVSPFPIYNPTDRSVLSSILSLTHTSFLISVPSCCSSTQEKHYGCSFVPPNFSSRVTCEHMRGLNHVHGVQEIDLSDPEAKRLIVMACQQFGSFKLVNHDVPIDLITQLENEALKFFSQPQPQKDEAGPPDPYGYGSKRIGTNGDMGWVEYLLFNTNPDAISPKTLLLLELSTPNFRVNRYPSCAELEVEVESLNEQSLIGFGEHTDPQIISILRLNNTLGLQICLQDGTWASIPPDYTSFFVIVADLLQVMTNGSFKSVKHRVLAGSTMSRLSMIYFGGPPLSQKIAPLPSLVTKEEESLYKELINMARIQGCCVQVKAF